MCNRLHKMAKQEKNLKSISGFESLGTENVKSTIHFESLGTENRKSTFGFEKIGTEKLYLLARLDEPEREEIQQTVNLEDVSVRELKAEIARLKEEKAAAETAMKTAEDERNKSSEELMTVQGEKELIKMQLERRQKALDAANEKITELENRPVEVAVQVQDNPEDKKAIQRLKNDLGRAHV